METRSRKRAEASSAASSQLTRPATRSSKRARISPSSSSAAVHTGSFSSTFPSASVISTRSRNAVSSDSFSPSILPMDSTNESLTTSGSRRRGKNHVSETNNLDKGKEKEHEVRARARDKEVVLKVESGGLDEDDDEDDDYSEGGVGVLHHNLTTASSALQGLLRKLGAGLDDLLPSTGAASGSSSQNNGRFKKILSGLRADGEEGRQIEALSQLCDMILLMGTEDSLSTLSVDSFVPVLVGLLNYERNPDIMLLAARAITHLCDFLPSSCAAVVHYGAVSPLCERLLTIEYMDLAEQCLQALKKISQEHPTACLRAGALMAVLSYLDFFSTGVQRVALSTAANICKKLPADATDLAMEVVPILTNLLQYHDTKVLEDASICLTRIVESLLPFPEKLDEICNSGLVSQAASLISTSNIGGGQSSLSSLTYTGLIRLLFAFASGSPLGAKTLLLLGISGILKDALSGSSTTSSNSLSPALNRPPNQIFEIVNLANELLPPLPQGVISFSVVACSKGSFLKGSPSRAIEKQENVSVNGLEASAREKLLNDQPDILKQFGMDLLSVLIQIYGSSVNSTVRHKCLSVIGKLMYFSTADMIQPLITQTNISSFLAGILAWKDPLVLVPALQIAEILMEKLPEIFSKLFVKEGVVHAVDVIISLGSPNTVFAQPILSEKNNEPGTSLRSSRYRRRSGITSDANSTEEPKTSSAVCIDSPPLSLMDIPAANANLGSTICSCAKAFKSKYFSSSRGTDDVGVTDDFLRLKEFSTKLSMGVEDIKNKSKGKSKNHLNTSFEKEKILMDIICDMLNELNRGDGVSTFEFIGSGVVTAFLNYFSCGHFFKEKASDSDLPSLRRQALKRFKSFICVALSSSNSSVGGDSLMVILIQKLQNALSSLDCFPVVLSHSSRLSTGSTQTSTGLSSLSSLSQPFKLRLCREQGDKSLRDFSSNIVLIDPLASIASIEDFLFPRVQRVEPRTSTSLRNSDAGNTSSVLAACSPSLSTPSLTRRQSTRSRSSSTIANSNKDQSREKSLSNSKGKGKVVVKPSPDQSGPQTRNAIRRKAALDKDMQGTRGGDSSSEELGISPCDVDGALMIEDENISDDEHVQVLGDDLLPVCTPGAVHDVKLGDMADDNATAPSASSIHAGIFSGGIRRTSVLKGSDSNDFRNGGLFGSQGAMSFAAAAMSGLASSNGRSIKGDSDILGRTDPPRLKLSAGGKTLNRHMTIYQAIQRQLVVGEEDGDKQANSDFVSNEVNKLWSDVYTITYQRGDTHTEKGSAGGTASSTTLSTKLYKTVIPSASSFDAPGTRASLLDSMVQGELLCDLEKSNPTYNILALLRVLEGVNQLSHRLQVEAILDSFAEGKIQNLDGLNTHFRTVPSEAFLNSKLTPKLTRQIQDALALCSRSLPSWCYQLTKACPFLFPFETRRQYFYSTAFGLPRALYRLQLQQGADGHGSSHDRGVRLGRLERQKVRVSRNHVLDSAIKVMEIYSSQKSVLEVEYFGEVGTGLGPTLEFYTLLSHDLQKVSLGMWRCDEYDKNGAMEMDGFQGGINNGKGKSGSGKLSTDDIVKAPLGLFPRPWPPNSSASDASPIAKVVEYFHLLGRVMAKALQDGRLLDLPISTGLYKILLGHELDLHDIFSFDPELGKTLQQFQAIVYRKNYLESMGSSDAISSISLQGVPINNLYLDFTLPGYPDYVLKPVDDDVDISNLEEYVSLVVDATVKTGIKAQVEALRAGFNQVVDISSLQIFSPHELDNLLCGLRDSWEVETLTDYIKFDHGFTAKSPPIVNLLEIMGEFTVEQQRAFCRFVTGAPRLPPGGLAVLNPKLTIVRKNPSNPNTGGGNMGGVMESSVDMDLPSVMTCANYLKLPPYTTKEIMYNKLMYAITEGQCSFDLS